MEVLIQANLTMNQDRPGVRVHPEGIHPEGHPRPTSYFLRPADARGFVYTFVNKKAY
jgi:hypothetical protein